MSLILDGSNGITFPNSSTQAVGFYGFKNRIINGAMVIDQRNAGASVTPNSQYTLDRWQFFNSQTGKFTTQQNQGSATLPVGFANYMGFTSTSAYSIGAGDYFGIRQPIEGFNISDLGWGTVAAKTVTLSFLVQSSLTGTFGGVLKDGGSDYSYPFTYTISSANTWTTVSVTIVGPTSGTWNITNGVGVYVSFGLGVGSTFNGTAGSWQSGNYISATGATSVVGTNGATFYITGVQLEAGSTATSFDYRPYGTELALCQRYYYRFYMGDTSNNVGFSGYCSNTTTVVAPLFAPVQLRAKPTLETLSGNSYMVTFAGGNIVCNATPASGNFSLSGALLSATVASGLTAGQGMVLRNAGALSSEYISLSAEL